jgi:hypothetical protein
MARLSKDVVVVSKPVRTFPNGDFFYIELCRKNSRYECVVCMNCATNPKTPVIVARAQGKTIREAEEKCYRTALERCPRFPNPPYFRRGQSARRVVSRFRSTAVRDTRETESKIPEPVR